MTTTVAGVTSRTTAELSLCDVFSIPGVFRQPLAIPRANLKMLTNWEIILNLLCKLPQLVLLKTKKIFLLDGSLV